MIYNEKNFGRTAMTSPLVCWKCGASIEEWPLPLSRLADCKACHAELHVCRQCLFYDTAKAKQCREPIAEEVKEKTRANFCDYFQVRPDAYQAQDRSAAEAARAELEALFGIGKNDGT
jgi:hypothetical protein